MKELIFIRIGSNERPAVQADIDDMAKSLKKAIKKKQPLVLTHHLIQIERVPVKDSKIQVISG